MKLLSFTRLGTNLLDVEATTISTNHYLFKHHNRYVFMRGAF